MFEPYGEPHSGEPGSGVPGRARGSVASGDLVRAARALAGLDAGGLSDDAALAVLDDLEEARRALDAVTCDLVSEVDSRGLTLARFGMQTPAAFGMRYGWPAAKAKQCLGVGRAVRRLTHVGDALRDGTINLHHADVICRAANPRVADVIADCQEELVALAGGVRFERFARDVAALADLADQDGGHDPRPEDNRLSVADGPGGSLVLKGTFVGDLAACLRHALAARADKLLLAHREDRRHCPELAAPVRGQLLAEALAELVRAGHAAGGTRAPVVDVTLVLPTTAVPPSDGLGFGAGTGAGGSVLGTQVGRCTDVAGLRYSTHTVKLLCCDARFHPLAVSATGVPLDLGSTVRLANRHQRRAASVRDGGCVFPGCDAPPSWTDLHHVIHAGPDGPTDMWNLASLCRRHHGIVHRRGWSMTADGDQWFTFTTPAGTTVGSQRHGRQRDRQPTPR